MLVFNQYYILICVNSTDTIAEYLRQVTVLLIFDQTTLAGNSYAQVPSRMQFIAIGTYVLST